ncbi:SDR family oxidoreductase [Polynucleobacter sp. MWH-Mekk-B1]|uniref:UDP-2-acetamido-2,6-beta-L-arabino-hexul-4-ose reductase n=1 Tax=Polynucleobacter finlandensis TaxID=1855894 RepID=UPI001C0BF791|nr:NAD-dependent epimerase/dehydratase family protein [Polynucleobacter finlandensis]MBU3543968.1 SDR family oxidoreductase [Polynucleobacter finlandensis]
MRVLITGADGFIGKNLCQYFVERSDIQVIRFTRENSLDELPKLLQNIDFIFHLAGVNRPLDDQEFIAGNIDFTQKLCGALANEVQFSGRKIPIIFSSSAQATVTNAYGESKKGAENFLVKLHQDYGIPVYIYRLPNVFGKWCKPNYNSVVATFCHNIARGLPVQVNDASVQLTLVYIDDVIDSFVQLLDSNNVITYSEIYVEISPSYSISVGELANLIQVFKESRSTLKIERVGMGLVRALYSTYMSYLPPASFSYEAPKYADSRGAFVEMIKTLDSGQVSYFTSIPGVTRGGHYHHSKSEKFLVIQGAALFRFRNIQTTEFYEITTHGGEGVIVETVPGWTHDVTNIGIDVLICAIWANENFDRSRPDTFTCAI